MTRSPFFTLQRRTRCCCLANEWLQSPVKVNGLRTTWPLRVANRNVQNWSYDADLIAWNKTARHSAATAITKLQQRWSKVVLFVRTMQVHTRTFPMLRWNWIKCWSTNPIKIGDHLPSFCWCCDIGQLPADKLNGCSLYYMQAHTIF